MRPDDQMEGFAAAFEDLFDRAVALARRVVSDRASAEDVAAEALARAFGEWDRIGGSDSYRTGWVLRVATNLAIDVVRRRPPDLPEAQPVEFEDASTLRLSLADALRDLPQRQREVVVLRYMAGMSQEQVAAALGISAGTVGTHSSRGLSSLRGLLGDLIEIEVKGGRMQVASIEEAARLVGTNRVLQGRITHVHEDLRRGWEIDIGVPATMTFRGNLMRKQQRPIQPPAVGDVLECVVVDVVPEEHRVLVAIPVPAGELEQWQERARIIARLKPGDVLPGRVTSIVPFGALVQIFSVDGLVHVSEMGDGVTDPTQAVQMWDDVDVEVVGTHVPLQRLSFRLISKR